MDEFTTLVFKSDTEDSIAAVGAMAQLDICRAWSMDHEILRLELIDQALDNNDIDRAKKYISADGVVEFKDDLTT